jgi:hypothetical protein
MVVAFLFLVSEASGLKAFDVDHRFASANEDIHDDKLLVSIWINVAVYDPGRYVEEVAFLHHDSIDLSRTIFQPNLACELKAVEMPCSMVMPGRDRPTKSPRP